MTSLWDSLAEELGKRDKFATPLEVSRFIDPNTVVTPALELIEEALIRVANTPDSRLIITMPPQEGKSTLLQSFEAWVLWHKRDCRIMTVSYSADLAKKNGREVKRHVEKMGLPLAKDQRSVTDWQLLEEQGGMFASSIGGALAGRPTDLLVIDDPIKNQQEADSEAYRSELKTSYSSDLVTRFAPGTSAILLQTRWHDDDLAGHLMREYEGDWEVLNIPAQCEDPATDPLGRKEGEYMISARGRTAKDWELRKREMGTRAWTALCQGNPIPSEGNVLDPDWLKPFKVIPPIEDCILVQSWDLAFSGESTSDYTVGQVWAIYNGRFYLVDQVRGQWNFPQAVAQFRLLSERWPGARGKLVEAKANGQALIDSLKGEGVVGLIPINPKASKVARVNAVAPLMEAGDVFVREGSNPALGLDEIATELEREVARFPFGKNDDQVDAMSQFLLFVTSGKRKRS